MSHKFVSLIIYFIQPKNQTEQLPDTRQRSSSVTPASCGDVQIKVEQVIDILSF